MIRDPQWPQDGRHHLSATDPYQQENTMAESRPKPITDAVKYVGSGISAALAVVQTLVVLGVLSNAQATQVTEFGHAINSATPLLADAATTIAAVVGGLITLGTGVLASFGVAKTAESRVTPIESPRDEFGTPLITSAPDGPRPTTGV